MHGLCGFSRRTGGNAGIHPSAAWARSERALLLAALGLQRLLSVPLLVRRLLLARSLHVRVLGQGLLVCSPLSVWQPT